MTARPGPTSANGNGDATAGAGAAPRGVRRNRREDEAGFLPDNGAAGDRRGGRPLGRGVAGSAGRGALRAQKTLARGCRKPDMRANILPHPDPESEHVNPIPPRAGRRPSPPPEPRGTGSRTRAGGSERTSHPPQQSTQPAPPKPEPPPPLDVRDPAPFSTGIGTSTPCPRPRRAPTAIRPIASAVTPTSRRNVRPADPPRHARAELVGQAHLRLKG